MSYADLVRQHARIAILRFLEDAPKYTSNVSMLAAALPRVGIEFTRADVVKEVRWLEDQGVVEAETTGDLIIVTANTRGVEIATGIARHPDIQRPKPGS